MKAFILLRVEMGHLEDVATTVRNIPGVICADPTFGEYDVIIEARVQSMHELSILVSREIQCTPGVQQTHTCIAFE